jgi:predicted Zn-dependent protease
MLDSILDALKRRADLSGWSVQHTITRGQQLYAVPQGIESRRGVDGERYRINVFRKTSAPDGSPALGNGNATLLPGGDVQAAIEQAALVAGLVANPVHSLPGPAPLPDVPLVDPSLRDDAGPVLEAALEEMRSAASRQRGVRLTSAECFSEYETVHLVNSRGIDARQEMTEMEVEFVLHAEKAGREVETMGVITRRRASDLGLAADVEEKARHALDLLDAGPPPAWQGPVILRGDGLVEFMASGSTFGSVPLGRFGSASSKYSRLTNWEIGKPVFRGEVKGDPLTVWANRTIPYGTDSSVFDSEGLPAQRVEFIRDNVLVNYTASQRYADYLGVPATGAFGVLELPPGRRNAASLLTEPHVEILHFSWFHPDPVTGNFASEIRFGYMVENGVRKPFKGGQLIGNYMDALADVCWSAETGFFGTYVGPHTARFNALKVAGE